MTVNYLDENVSYSIALGLRHRGLDVTTTPEENLLGVSDEIQLHTIQEYDKFSVFLK